MRLFLALTFIFLSVTAAALLTFGAAGSGAVS
jgi:hypothetical protein